MRRGNDVQASSLRIPFFYISVCPNQSLLFESNFLTTHQFGSEKESHKIIIKMMKAVITDMGKLLIKSHF